MADQIILVTETDEETPDGQKGDGQKGMWGDAKAIVRRLREVRLSPDLLEQNMLAFLKMVGRLFHQADAAIGEEADLQLEEVELSVEISTEGEVKLVAGGKAAGKGAITLKFKRLDSK